MSHSERELTHPSWRRASDDPTTPRESLMSQMVRAQLIFDRRTPAAGLPAWRDADGDVTPVERDATPVPFAQELAERLQLARDRVEAEQVHLAQVDTVAAAYLGHPQLRLVK
ncbi:MAG: hypothetical protein NTW72_15705 [Gemmatimonadetes bacterium]|nr:hypothetical protein [Gemmatimonadota bacterium]